MNNNMEGPIQVLAPRAIAISQRQLYSTNKNSSGSNGPTTNHGSAVSSVVRMPANKIGPGGELGGPTMGAVEEEELGVSEGGQAPTGLVLPVGSVPAPSLIPSSASASLRLPPRSQRQHNTRRRIFVQTDSGAVVVVEVDCAAGRSAASEKVKRSVQEALNVPTEQADLMFGGHVLEDLNELQNDVPVLLRRGITRSASSPCLNRLSSSAPSTHAGVLFSSSRGPTLSTTNCPGCEGGERDFGSEEAARPGDDSSAVFEVVGGVQPCVTLQALIEEAMAGVLEGMEPETATGGTGGAYCFRNTAGQKVVIVKPTDEEPFAPNNPNGYVGRALGQPGLKRAVRVGEAGIREVAAYLLDHDSFAGVPYTALVRAAHPSFNVNASATPVPTVPKSCSAPGCGGAGGVSEAMASSASATAGHGKGPGLASGAFLGCSGRSGVLAFPSKLCSLQQYMQHDYDTSECGTSRFPVSAVHRIGILDIRIFNTDRHSGNILVRRMGNERFERRHVNPVFRVDEAVQLIPIDHGFCLPETLDAAYFEWLHWPQASLPFSEEELQYIASLNVDDEVAMLRERLPMLREGCLRVLRLSTTLLQRGAAAGLTLADIGAIMSREVRGMEEVASELEALCLQALKLVTTPHDFSGNTDGTHSFDLAQGQGHLAAGIGGGLILAGAVQPWGTGAPEDARLGCVSPCSVGSSSLSSPRNQMELGAPGLLFDFEEVAEEDEDSEDESEGSTNASGPYIPVVPEGPPLDLPPPAGAAPARNVVKEFSLPEDCNDDASSHSSARWPVLKMGHWGSLPSKGAGNRQLQHQQGGGNGGGGLLHQALGSSAVASGRPTRTSGLSRALFKEAVPEKGTPSGVGLALAEQEPALEPAPPPASAGAPGSQSSALGSKPVSGARKVPPGRETRTARRAMPPLLAAGKPLFHTPPPQHPFRELSPPLPSCLGVVGGGAPRGMGPSGLKLGSAGVLGTRLKANAALTDEEQDLKGLLPGGASLLLADMEQRTWEHFYETFVELLDSLLLSKVVERNSSADLFGTSCQF